MATIQTINPYRQIYRGPTEVDKRQERNQLIKAVALTALKELAVALLFAGVTIIFAANPLTISMIIISAVVVTVLNAAMRSLYAHAKYQAFLVHHLHATDPTRIAAEKKAGKLETFTDYFCPISFALFDGSTRDIVTHEGGHALTSMLVYKNPNPSITIYSEKLVSSSGVTRFYPQKLSSLGQKLGQRNASTVVGAAGAAFSLTFSIGSIILSHKLKHSHPKLSRYFLASAITSIAHHALYALSALWASRKDLGHDFVRLWAGGIHPIVSLITIIALPLIVKAGLYLYDQRRK